MPHSDSLPDLPPLMKTSVIFAIAASASLAIYGAHAVTGHATIEARIALAIVVGAILAGEFAAAKLLIHARARQVEGARWRSALAIGLFAIVSFVAIGLSHHGLKSITERAFARDIAPIERSIKVAEAKLLAAQEAQTSLRRDMNARRSELLAQWAEIATGPRGLMQAEDHITAATAIDRQRLEIENEFIRRARGELAEWQAAKDAAPKPPQWAALLCVSIVIQALGGLLAWASTARPADPATPSGGASIYDLDAVRAMTPEELRAVKSKAASVMATATAALRRAENGQ